MADKLSDPAREIVKLAISPDWPTHRKTVDRAGLGEAIDRLANQTPLKRAEPDMKGEGSRALGNALRLFGGKIAPTAKASEAMFWRTSVMIALSDLPARTAIKAATLAIHRPMRFLNEVEGAIREEADKLIVQQRVALGRLRAFQRDIDLARMEQARIAAPSIVWTQEEVDQANEAFRMAGASMRYTLAGDDVTSRLLTAEESDEERNRLTPEHGEA